MATHLEILTQTIPRLFALCDTIQEAAAHGGKNSASLSAMKETIRAGITAVEAAARPINPEAFPQAAELDQLPALEGDALPPLCQRVV